MLGGHGIEIRKLQSHNVVPERSDLRLVNQGGSVEDVIRRVPQLVRNVDVLVGQVVQLSVLDQKPDRAVAEEEAADTPTGALAEEDRPAALPRVRDGANGRGAEGAAQRLPARLSPRGRGV